MGIQTIKDDYTEMALLGQRREQAQAGMHSQQSEHRRRSKNIIKNSIDQKSLKLLLE